MNQRGAIAPTVGLAMYVSMLQLAKYDGLMLCRYQSSTVAYHYSTIGYLIPIMSILTVPVLPRARFIQNLLVTCVLTPLILLGRFFELT